MARLARDSRLETREARLRLPMSHEPYWRQLTPGVFLGYRKGPTGGVWIARVSSRLIGRLDGSAYVKQTLGTADDYQESNGVDLLTYRDAFHKVQEFAEGRKNHGKSTERYTVADAVTDYLAGHYAKEGRALRDTTYAIEAHILPQLGKLLVRELKPETIDRWLVGLTKAPIRNRGKRIEIDQKDREAVRKRRATANRVLTILKAALNFAYRAGKAATDDAWRRVKPFRNADAPKIRYLTADEARRLVNAATADFRELVRAALQTGCRYGELIRMHVGDFDPDSGTVHVRESKSGKSRHVPLTDEGRGWFEHWATGRRGDQLLFTRADGLPWDRSHQTRRMKEACVAASIFPPVSFHELRHTYASFLATAGVSDQVIAEALGHADTRMTTRHYAHLKPNYVADQLRTHLPKLGEPENAVRRLTG